MEKTTVLIVDRQSFFRAGARQALESEPDLEIMDVAPGDELMGIIETRYPGAVLLDIDVPSLSGLELCRRIIRYYPSVRVIMMTPNPNDEQLFEVIKTGAVAYLDKNTSGRELAEKIRQACRGEYPINDSLTARPSVAEHVLRQFQSMVQVGRALDTVAAPLTSRERQILSYVAEGNSNKQIAHILEISEQTIKNHVSAILRKLNANDRAHAVVLAIRQGLISAEELS
jgi:two-component system, NarL family, response regulator DegU